MSQCECSTYRINKKRTQILLICFQRPFKWAPSGEKGTGECNEWYEACRGPAVGIAVRAVLRLETGKGRVISQCFLCLITH